jgi:hypothetical protein
MECSNGNYHGVGHCHCSGQPEEHDSQPEPEPVVDEQPPVVDEQPHLQHAAAILGKV